MPVIATRKMSLKLADFCVVRAALSEKVAALWGDSALISNPQSW